MRNKLSVVLFTAVLVAVFLSASIVFAADAKHPRTTFKLDRAPKYLIPFERGPADMTPGPVSLRSPVKKYPFVPPGNVAGLTTYDYQHNGSMGRLLAADLIHSQMFFVWMAQTNFTIPGDRHIRGQLVDLATGLPLLGSTGAVLSGGDYAGYTNCAARPDGTYGGSSVAFHTPGEPTPGEGDWFPRYVYDESVCLGIPPVPIWQYEDLHYHEEGEFIWPVVTSHLKDDGDNLPLENVVYVLAHAGNDEPDEELILFRRVGDLCDTAIHFDTGRFIVEEAILSYVIEADPNSNNVAIVYTDDRAGLGEGEGGQNDLDVYYMMSTDQGATWGAPINVSNYTEEDSLWRAFTDLTAVFSQDGTLHIVWNARELRDANTYEDDKCRLVHWDNLHQKQSIIDEARYEMERVTPQGVVVPCSPGVWNMYIAKMSVAECDNKLYCLFTKFGDANEPGALSDCSDGNFANGELYLSGSDDNGQTWDTAWNITKTRTPNCDSAFCMSEHWSSLAIYGIAYGDESVPDTFDISYIYDRDAGGIPQGEGSWCTNEVMHYRFPCREVAHIPRPSYEPNSFLDPLHTLPATELKDTLKISNIGNAELDIEGISATYHNGSNWMAFGAPTVDPIPLGGFSLVEVTFNAGGALTADPSGWDGTIDIDHNGPSDVDHLPVHLTVATDFNLPENDTLRTTTKKLMVYNTGRLGGDNDGAALDIAGDCDAAQTTPNADLFLYDASPMMAWDNDGITTIYTSIFTQLFTQDGTFRPQSNLIMESFPAEGYNKMTCTLSTTDSIFGVGVEAYASTDGNDFVIMKYEFTTWKPGLKGMDQVHVGMFLDWDIPSDENVRNASGYNETLFAVWQRGAELNSDDEDEGCPITEDQRYGGVAVLAEEMVNAWTGENSPIQQGSGLNPDTIMNRMANLAGYNMYDTTGQEEDTVIDLHTGITFAEVDMTAKATYTHYVAMVTTNNGLSDLETQIAAAKLWAEEKGIVVLSCECLPGDANDDNDDEQYNVGDAVYIITYVFKGGPPPTPWPICSGDPNGDCQVNVGDAVYLINYVFKGGPAPATCEEWRDGGGVFPGCGEIQ